MLQDKAKKSGDEFKVDDYFIMAEPHMERQWNYYVWKRIEKFKKKVVVDLACGHGRNTEFLRKVSGTVIAADINQECIDACAKRFTNADNVQTLLIDGCSLKEIPDNSVDLVYSFDAMVHFEPEVIEAYINEFARILTRKGHGFIHHSNNWKGEGKDFRKQPHWRNYMTKDLFAKFLMKAGLKLVSQTVINWDESYSEMGGGLVLDLDCITIFTK